VKNKGTICLLTMSMSMHDRIRLIVSFLEQYSGGPAATPIIAWIMPER